MEVWHFLQAAEEVVRAGVFESFVHQVVRAWARFTCFTFHRLVSTGGFFLFACWGCWVGVCLAFHVLLTNLCDRVVYRWLIAQLRDCHSCYDERSIVQKKSGVASTAWVSMLMCILVVALVWSNWEWPLALTLGCTVLYNTLSFLEAGVLG